MTDATTKLSLRIKEITEPQEELQVGFYWTLDAGPEDECFWSGPHTDLEAAKVSAIEALQHGYLAAATQMLTGE